MIYSLPPVVRLTDARHPPACHPTPSRPGTCSARRRRQLLFKVQLPQAVPSIATGVNQTINMALGIIVIAALVGAGGLGQEALEMLRLRSHRARARRRRSASLCVAILLDRVSRSFVEQARAAAPRRRRNAAAGSWLAVAAIVLVVVGRAAHWTAFPHDWGVKWADSVDTAVKWVRDTFHDQASWLNDSSSARSTCR